MIGEQLARETVTAADVDLACALNDAHELDRELDRLRPSPALADKAGHAAILACLGSAEARARVLAALTASDEREVEIAQVYLNHRPITDETEMRAVVTSVAGMKAPAAQIRALDALARLHLSDRPEPGGADTPVPAHGLGRRPDGDRRSADPCRLPRARHARAGADAAPAPPASRRRATT